MQNRIPKSRVQNTSYVEAGEENNARCINKSCVCAQVLAQLRYGTAFATDLKNASMIALEFKEPLEVTTPKGDGYIWYMMDYGPQSDTLYTIIIKETGECWQLSHKDFRVKKNTTLGIRERFSKNGHSTLAPVDGRVAEG